MSSQVDPSHSEGERDGMGRMFRDVSNVLARYTATLQNKSAAEKNRITRALHVGSSLTASIGEPSRKAVSAGGAANRRSSSDVTVQWNAASEEVRRVQRELAEQEDATHSTQRASSYKNPESEEDDDGNVEDDEGDNKHDDGSVEDDEGESQHDDGSVEDDEEEDEYDEEGATEGGADEDADGSQDTRTRRAVWTENGPIEAASPSAPVDEEYMMGWMRSELSPPCESPRIPRSRRTRTPRDRKEHGNLLEMSDDPDYSEPASERRDRRRSTDPTDGLEGLRVAISDLAAVIQGATKVIADALGSHGYPSTGKRPRPWNPALSKGKRPML